jgi:hypothetical protein
MQAMNMFFGLSSEKGSGTPPIFTRASCPRFSYVWGRLNSFTDMSEIKVWGMACNATIDTVDVAVTFRGPLLDLGEDNAIERLDQTIRPVDRTSRALDMGFSDELTQDIFDAYENGIYGDASLASLPPPSNTILDQFFRQLVTSRHAISPDGLGSSSGIDEVQKAVLFHITASSLPNTSAAIFGPSSATPAT